MTEDRNIKSRSYKWISEYFNIIINTNTLRKVKISIKMLSRCKWRLVQPNWAETHTCTHTHILEQQASNWIGPPSIHSSFHPKHFSKRKEIKGRIRKANNNKMFHILIRWRFALNPENHISFPWVQHILMVKSYVSVFQA